MTKNMPMLKFPRANYIFIPNNGFFKTNGCVFNERIQTVSVNWPLNIETSLQFLDYREI